MTGLAGNRSEMGVDALVFMFLIHVTLFAGNLLFGVNGVIVREHATKDLMIGRDVTISALHVEVAAHVYIKTLIGEI